MVVGVGLSRKGNMELFVGIDWGASMHSVCVLDETGNRLWEAEVPHTGDAVHHFAERIVALAGGDPQCIRASMEAPHGVMVEALIDRGVGAYFINPKQLDRFRDRHSVSGAKDDALDAFVLADSLRTDLHLYRRIRLPEPELLRLRSLSRRYEALTRQVVALGNQISEELRRYFPQMEKLGRWHEEAWLWDLFAQAATPSVAQKLRLQKIEKVLKTHRIRRWKPTELKAQLTQTPLPVAPGVAEAASESIELNLPVLRALRLQRETTAKRMKGLLEQLSEETDDPEKKHHDAAIIQSLPGIGTKNGAVMLTEASAALQLRDATAFRNLAGTRPVSRRTGGRKKKATVIMRKAKNTRLGQAVHHWAQSASRYDNRAQTHYQSLRSRGCSHGRALRGVADRLIALMFSMLREGKLYDSERWNNPSCPCPV